MDKYFSDIKKESQGNEEVLLNKNQMDSIMP
jgi:hypothetical protein